ncbi:MAG: sigma 54-interacting transcriptional regulator [Myxococcota bacterium]
MDETLSLGTGRQADGAEGPARPALVVLWCADEPERAGEVAWLDDPPLVLGRSGTLAFVRARPGGDEPTPPLRAPRISREQLRIVAEGRDLLVENLGRCPMLLNGRPTPRCPWVPGALIELQDQLLLRCERRGPLPAAPSSHPFGEPDADGIVGETPEAWEIRRQIAFCGPLDAHVLVRGPSGSGKELVARALHARSRRRRSALVSRNAATFPETLIEAELFGNLAGFPNPGMPARPGLVGAADGSTLFLDEFGELPPAQQARLLRVLDQGEYTRLGEARATRADLRLVAATNRPLDVLKSDVLARFPLRIELPGLDLRRADVPLVAAQLLRRIAREEPHLARFVAPSTGTPRITASLVAALVDHPYTTHVRELSCRCGRRCGAAPATSSCCGRSTPRRCATRRRPRSTRAASGPRRSRRPSSATTGATRRRARSSACPPATRSAASSASTGCSASPRPPAGPLGGQLQRRAQVLAARAARRRDAPHRAARHGHGHPDHGPRQRVRGGLGVGGLGEHHAGLPAGEVRGVAAAARPARRRPATAPPCARPRIGPEEARHHGGLQVLGRCAHHEPVAVPPGGEQVDGCVGVALDLRAQAPHQAPQAVRAHQDGAPHGARAGTARASARPRPRAPAAG